MHNLFRSQLHILQTDLSEVQPATPEAHSAIETLRVHISHALEQVEFDLVTHGYPLYQHLKGSVLQFEAAHPELAASTQNVIDTLVKLGV